MTWFLLSGDSAPAVSSSGDLASLGGFMEGMTLVGMLSVAGWAIGYCGQPHVVVRFMAVRSREDVKVSRRIALVWSSITMISAVAVGASVTTGSAESLKTANGFHRTR